MWHQAGKGEDRARARRGRNDAKRFAPTLFFPSFTVERPHPEPWIHFIHSNGVVLEPSKA